MAKMIRIAGRGLDNTAKGIRTDNRGYLITTDEKTLFWTHLVRDVIVGANDVGYMGLEALKTNVHGFTFFFESDGEINVSVTLVWRARGDSRPEYITHSRTLIENYKSNRPVFVPLLGVEGTHYSFTVRNHSDSDLKVSIDRVVY